MAKCQRPLRVEVLELKAPASGTCTPKEIEVEGVKNSSLLIMIVNLTAVVLNHLNFVVSVPLICAGVEKAGVFVTFKCCPNFASLFPKEKLRLRHPAEDTDNQGSESRF